jgi:predicted RNA-binding protein (virulence factor B family)
MTTSILFYDHIQPQGAFVKGSKIGIKASVKVIRENGGAQMESYLNSLKFASIHYNDESTPKAIKAVFG